MNHIVSIGGGTSSTLELPLEVIRKYGRDNVVLVIACLSGESPDLWRNVEYAQKVTGVKVTYVYYDPNNPKKYSIGNNPEHWLSIWDVFDKVKFIGNSRIDPCSRVLKRETMKRYITDLFSPETTILHIGITGDEIERTVAIMKNWESLGYKVECDLTKKELQGSSGERALCISGFVPEMYKQGFTHLNCDGGCVKAGLKHWARLLWFKPSVYFYHAFKESEHQEKHEHKYTILRRYKTEIVESKLTKNGVIEIIKEKKKVPYPISLFEFALVMFQRWNELPEGTDPFDYNDLDETTACKFCDSMA